MAEMTRAESMTAMAAEVSRAMEPKAQNSSSVRFIVNGFRVGFLVKLGPLSNPIGREVRVILHFLEFGQVVVFEGVVLHRVLAVHADCVGAVAVHPSSRAY